MRQDDRVGERLEVVLEVVLRYGSYRLVIVPSFCCKVLLYYVLTEKWQVDFITFGDRLGLLQVRDCKGGCVRTRL